jgi:DHA1 family multidrug resistance protein-like MFS transporter
VSVRSTRSEQARLLLPLGAAIGLSLAGDSTLYTVLANQTAVVGISLGEVGILLGANRLIRIPGNPLVGALYDRLGRRPLFLWGLALGVVSTAAYGWARGFWPMLSARLLWGIAWALINVGGYTMVVDRSTPADRGRMTGLYQTSYLLGLSISPLVGGGLTDALGFRQAVQICAGLQTAGLLVALWALPETAPQARPAIIGAMGPRMHRPGMERLGAWLTAVRRLDPGLLAVAAIYLVVFFVSNGVLMSTISLYLGQRWGERIPLGATEVGVASLAGIALSLRVALGIVAAPVAGVVSDRLHSRWPVVYGGLGLVFGGFLLLVLPVPVWAVLAAVCIGAAGAGALIAVLAAMVGDRVAGVRPGMAMGALATAGDTGSAAGPLVAYALVVGFGLQGVYLLCLLALVFVAILSLPVVTQSQSVSTRS